MNDLSPVPTPIRAHVSGLPRCVERVGLVADWCLPQSGGIELHIMGLAKQLRRRGLEVTIVTSYPGPEVIDGVPIDRLDCLRLPWLELAVSPLLAKKLRDSFIKGRFDIVHIHASIVAPTCLAAVRAAISLGLPTIVTFHSVMNTMPHLLNGLDKVSGWSNRNVRLTAVSGLIASQLRRVLNNQVDVLPNAFDHGFWRRADARVPRRDGFRLISATRLQPRKRPLALVDIFAEAARRAPDTNLSLTIAGDGDLAIPLRGYIARRGMTERISVIEWQTQEKLRDLYHESSAFIMPSRKEAFCVAALEARTARLPVIANAGTGIADFVTDGISGLLATNDSQMADAIVRLAGNPELQTALSCDDPSLARYDWLRLTDEHLRLYAG